MTTYVPAAVQQGLDSARVGRLKKASRLRIETADGYFRVLRMWDTGFSVSSADAPHLRGFVDVYEGPTHLFQCLIIAANEETGEMNYEFKRLTAVANRPARDFAAEADAPVALIENAGLTA